LPWSGGRRWRRRWRGRGRGVAVVGGAALVWRWCDTRCGVGAGGGKAFTMLRSQRQRWRRGGVGRVGDAVLVV